MPCLRRLAPLAFVAFALLAAGSRPALAQAGTLKEIEVPAAEKAKETSIVLVCTTNEDDEFLLFEASRPNTTIEVLRLTIEGDPIIETLKDKLQGFKELRARVAGIRKCTKIAVPVSGKPPNFREIDYTFTMKTLEWTKNPDEYFQAKQTTEAKAEQACNLIIAGDLPKAVAALKEAQALAENIQYGTNPFEHFDSTNIAWADMVVSLEQVQKDEVIMKAAAGGFDELQSTLRFYYDWHETFPHHHIPKMNSQTTDIVDGLMKTANRYSSGARQRLVSKLKSGALKVGTTETERCAKEWNLGYITTLAYMLFQAGKFQPTYEMIRDAIMLKESADLKPKEDLMIDLMGWMATNKDFVAALPPETVLHFPGMLEQMVHKVDDSENLERIKQEAVEALTLIQKNNAGLAWDPPIDQVLAKFKKDLPPAVGDPHANHGS